MEGGGRGGGWGKGVLSAKNKIVATTITKCDYKKANST
jgi:hypothetical protein